ncbi:MAG: hypothetical protein IJ860_05290 [Eubacterium sp.]|nr:hypothetical protein [Eubacterium sp.]
MLKRLSELLRKNLGLKVLSIFIAVIIWYAVVSVNDPVITRSFSVKIATANETYIQNGKQLFRIEDEYKTVIVYLKANRSTLRTLDAEDILVTADLTQIVDLDADPVMVPLSVSCPGVDRANITLARTAIPITIEEISSREFQIVVDTGDSKPASSYEVGKVTANPEKVTLTGPASVVNEIESVVAKIDVSGMTYSAQRSATLILYDRDQNEVTPSTIEDDITFSTGSTGTMVSVELWKRKSDVKLNVEHNGMPMSGYQVGTISTTPETISVVGDEESLAALEEKGNSITIPAEYVDVSNASADLNIEVNLSELMPENMRIAANTAASAEVVVPILPEGSKEIQIDVDDIATKSLSEDLTVSYDQSEVTVLLTGSEEALTKLKASDLKPEINCKGLEEGDYNLTLKLSTPVDVEIVDTVKITVHIKQAARTS